MKDEDEGKILACDLTKEDASCFYAWRAWFQRNSRRHGEKCPVEDFFNLRRSPHTPANEADPLTVIPAPFLWNIFLVEGLLTYGFQKEAAGLVSRLINAAVQSLKQTRSFSEHANAQTGQPGGERGHLRGLFPVGIFLKVLGVQFLSEKEVLISGMNPFPWPITVKYRGTSITRHQKDSVITFINGQTITVTGPGNHRVILEENPTRERRI